MSTIITTSSRSRSVGVPREGERSSRRSSYVVESHDTAYRPVIAPRNVIIQRTTGRPPTSQRPGSRAVVEGSYRRNSFDQSFRGSGGAPNYLEYGGSLKKYSAEACNNVNLVLTARVSEKKDMQDLNERFASYIEKVRFLEAQNRRLADELTKLKARWGKETFQVRAMYEGELAEARKCLDEGDKEKSKLEIQVVSLQEQLDELRQRLSLVSHALSEERERNESLVIHLKQVESELFQMRRRNELLESDREKYRTLIATLNETVTRIRIDLDNETLLRVDASNRYQTLEEELEFLRAVHEQELKELSALAYRDTTLEHREFWKNEMGLALREITDVYDEKMDAMRNELETFYSLKIQETRTSSAKQNIETAHSKEETTKFKTQVTDLRHKLGDLEANNAALRKELELLKRESETRERNLEAEIGEYKLEVTRLRFELEAVLKELQSIMDFKLSLELEIAAYRRLLEGEENRVISAADNDAVDSADRLTRYSATEEQRLKQELTEMKASSTATALAATATVDTTTTRVTQVVKGEMSAKTTYSRQAKGHIAIADCDSDGKFITIENNGKKEESMDGWRVRRCVDGLDKADFIIDSLTVQPATKLKIWARGCRPYDADLRDLEYYEESWGSGLEINTKLINAAGEERASHLQKTSIPVPS